MKEVAAAIFEALPAAKELKAFDEAADAGGYDLVFAGLRAGERPFPVKVEPATRLALLVLGGAPDETGTWPAADLLEFDGCDEETPGRAKLFARQVLERLHGIKATGCA